MVLPPIYKIHPAIGIARLGNASTYFIGPEIPGVHPTGEPPGSKVPPYKDGGKIKRQAARFRVFEYIDKGGQYEVSREVSLLNPAGDVTDLVWTVHLANCKASFFKFEGLAGFNRPHARDSRRNNHVVKDRWKLEINPLERSISGLGRQPVDFSKGTSRNRDRERWPDATVGDEIESLGTLLTDEAGRLLVLGGQGKAVHLPNTPIQQYDIITSYANNDGWFDDVSDGPVTVYLELNRKEVSVIPAWVICAPPDFAPHLANVVTLYDSMYDIAARQLTLPTNEKVYGSGGALESLSKINAEFRAAGQATLSQYEPDFATEIYPILYWAAMSEFVFGPAVRQHSALMKWNSLSNKDKRYENDRSAVFDELRSPDTTPDVIMPYMPKLLGDEPYGIPTPPWRRSGPSTTITYDPRIRLTLTHTQYALLQQWAKGKFKPSQVPLVGRTARIITPEGLDRAALENCVGGAFFPGIEAGWQTRYPEIYTEPFRIKHNEPSPYIGDSESVWPGYFTRQMALPWQADFLQCRAERPKRLHPFAGTGLWGWWPAQRPDTVFLSEGDFMKGIAPVPWHRATKARKKVDWPEAMENDHDVPSYDEMLRNWKKFGFVLEKKKDFFLEDEREADIPSP
jgi:hypothetical protein